MCGIAGSLSLAPGAPIVPDELRAMAGALVHRGPDDFGYHEDPQRRCGLAFRRLAIIDLTTGNQPVSNEANDIWLVFNGEIYNFRELREEMRAAGHTFRTAGDAEVIVHAYEQFGTGCFERLSGMFGVAIWDQRRAELILARDRFGKKPLVFAHVGSQLYFASEAKAILALPHVPREVDPQSLHRYLVFQYVPAPHAIFRGFAKVRPGHYVRFCAAQPAPAGQVAWWDLPDPPAFRGSYENAKRRLEELLVAAVRRRLISDVPLGAFLSGGIDSSIVVGLMRRLGVSPLRTFSIGFADARYDESAAARLVAQHFATEHHEERVTPRAREVLDTLAYHYDEPFADSSAIPTYYVSKYARQSVTVALTGDAGDESFGGYDRYHAAQLAARVDALPKVLRSGAAAGARLLPRGAAKSRGNRAFRFLEALAADPARRYLFWVNVFAPQWLAQAYRPEFAARLELDEPAAWLARHYAAREASPLAHAARADLATYLPFDLLTKVDVASMACSLECRAPFLDHELVSFALSLPADWKMSRTGRGKLILRDWASALLPAEILNRGKMGFGVPIGEWFRGELRDLLEASVLAPGGVAGRVLDPQILRRLVDEHQSGRANHEHRLWALLMLERWAQRWRPTGL